MSNNEADATTPPSPPITYYTLEEVKTHNTDKSLWIVLDNGVYDLTAFLHEHPGGEEVLMDVAGLDGTICFDNITHSVEARETRERYKIGEVVQSQWKTKIELRKSEEAVAYVARQTDENFVANYVIPVIVIAIAFYLFFFY